MKTRIRALLLINIGNTKTVIAVAKNNSIKISCSNFTSAINETRVKESLTSLGSLKNFDGIVICSVVRNVGILYKKIILDYVAESEMFEISALCNTGLYINYKPKSSLGADRLANAIAACTLFPSNNIIVVDVGTATTIDLIKSGGQFIGGAILPGPELTIKSLHYGTNLLPELNGYKILKEKQKIAIGNSTRTCMAIGLKIGYPAMINGVIQHFIQNLKWSNIQCIVTGGASSVLISSICMKCIFDPLLIFKGMIRFYELNCNTLRESYE